MTAATHNWDVYEERCRDSHRAWLQGLSAADGVALFEQLYVAVAATPIAAEDSERLERHRWASKLEIRKRLVHAFAALDRLRSERADPNNSG
jgi:hypothetical protein